MVYSTWSLNPIENEAVVQAALVKLSSKVHLVDVSDEVSPFLKYRKGLTAWKVFHKGKGVKNPAMWYTDWRSVPEHQSRDSNKDAVKLLPSMFSDIYTRANNLPGAKKQDPLGL